MEGGVEMRRGDGRGGREGKGELVRTPMFEVLKIPSVHCHQL